MLYSGRVTGFNRIMILGIDPGSRFTGYAVIDLSNEYVTSGVINLSSKKEFKNKLFFLSQQLDQLYTQYNISYLSLEKIFLGKNADSAFKLGHARGVCLLSAGRHGAHVFEYAAKYVKKIATGSGSSDKLTVQSILNKVYQTQILKEDESDALALAYCCFTQMTNVDRGLENFRI